MKQMKPGLGEEKLNETLNIKQRIAWQRKTFYNAWEEGEGVPVVNGVPFVEDVTKVPLKPWNRLGGKGAILNLSNQEEIDVHLMEVPKGGELRPERHMYEEIIYVVRGSGNTVFWYDNKKDSVTLNWREGSLFSPPLNCWHNHSNSSNDEPALLMAATNAPFYLSRYRNLDFIFNNNFEFKDRFPASRYATYFTETKKSGLRKWETNFIDDVFSFELDPWSEKGPGVRHMDLYFSENTLNCHIHEVPVGGYAKAHRHAPGAHVFILDGEGFELLWYEGQKKRRYNFHAGSIVSPGTWEYHQHFNTGNKPLRQLALRYDDNLNPKYLVGNQFYGSADTEILEYSKQEPEIMENYKKEIASKGIKVSITS